MISSELSKRIISAVILIPLVLFVTLWNNTVPFAIGIYFVILLGSHEVIQITLKSGEKISAIVVWAGAIAIPLCFQFPNYGWFLFGVTLVSLMFLSFLFKLFSHNPTQDVVRYVSVNVFTAVLFPFFMSFIWLTRMFPDGGLWILFLFVTIWTSDIVAYFVGSKFGKRYIVPSVSPKKSLEGFIGGFTGGIAAAFIFYKLFLSGQLHLASWQVILLACDVVVAGILGDLFESMMKRSAKIKDSGNVIPGHGGILDRVDSVLFAAPVLYIYISIFMRLAGNE